MMIPIGLYCIKGTEIFAQTFIPSTFVYKTVSSTEEKYTKQAKLENDKTFTFMQIISSHSTRLKIGSSASRPIHSSQVIVKKTSCMKACDKNSPQTPAHLQPPPGSSCQAVHLLFAPLLACRMTKGGGTSILVPF